MIIKNGNKELNVYDVYDSVANETIVLAYEGIFILNGYTLTNTETKETILIDLTDYRILDEMLGDNLPF
jgi:hypothetical protein